MAKKKKEDKDFEFEWDPIKYAKDGKQAQAVIWSTKVLEAAVEGMAKGLPLKANPFLGKNTKLLKPDLVFRRTEEEMADAEHCIEDPVFFASKCFLMTPEGLQPVVLRDYQVDYLRHLQKHRFSIFLSCRQSGKCNYFLSTVTIRTSINHSCLNKYEICDCIYKLPLFELYNIFVSPTPSWEAKYAIYSKMYGMDEHDEAYIQYENEIESIDREYENCKDKIVESISISGVEVYTDTGFKPVSVLYMTRPYRMYKVVLDNGMYLYCADDHIVFNDYMKQMFVKELTLDYNIMTEEGPVGVKNIIDTGKYVCMCDLTVDDDNHRFYSNGILSHNSTTTAIYCLWMILFHIDKIALILSKSGPAGADLLKKIKDMYMYLPYHLKLGTLKWNQGEISFDNNSSISTEPFSPTAGLGKTINFLILDEFAWCPPNDVELFYNNIIPTVTTITNSNVCIMSTQNGFNLFYKLWSAAEQGKNVYAPFKVDWHQVPQFNPETKTWDKRDNAWKEMMVGVLGSEQAFYYQYGTQFSASDKCIISRETISRLRDNTILFTSIEKIVDFAIPNYFSLHKQELVMHPNFDTRILRYGFFIILVDLAEGGGGDYTVFNILMLTGKDKFRQVGYWRSNSVDLENATLEFWLMYGQMFNPDRCIVSIEWNTYGALFYNYLTQYNEPEYKPEHYWRYNLCQEFDINQIIHYKKGSQEDELAGIGPKIHKSMIPGIRFSGQNKKTACALLKMMIERGQIEINDLVTISEIENFEDKNGNGTYAASFGHDDIIMTFCQIPMLINTARYKSLLEEFEAAMATDPLLHAMITGTVTEQGIEMATQAPNMYGNISQYPNDMGMPMPPTMGDNIYASNMNQVYGW